MKIAFLIATFASAVLLAHAEPASAVVSVDVDVVIGAGLLSDNSFLLMEVAGGAVTVGRQPPTNIDEGFFTLIVDKTSTQATCSIESVTPGCAQATIQCDDRPDPHTVIAAFPGTTFKGSFDGADMRAGIITISCIDKQIPQR